MADSSLFLINIFESLAMQLVKSSAQNSGKMTVLLASVIIIGLLRSRELQKQEDSVYNAKIYFKSGSLFEKLSLLQKIASDKQLSSFQICFTQFFQSFYSNKIFEGNIKFKKNCSVADKSLAKKTLSDLKAVLHVPNFHCERNVVSKEELMLAFKKVVNLYHEMPLPRYSRYENWSRSCYMEVHEKWTPKTDTNESLRLALEEVLEKGKTSFSRWYCFRNGLKKVKVVTMNSFVTKYIPKPGMNEFGKHVDGIKIDGSLIMALPEEIDLVDNQLSQPQEIAVSERHNWKGLIVWDAPREKELRKSLQKSGQDKFSVKLMPGDCCYLEKLVWHHGLPIYSGARYVIVCFYQCSWQEIDA